jgi:colanic acid biosynthesis glycosyl transferase WcaI
MIVGAGARRGEVEHDIASRGLRNVTLLPPVAREELSASLNAADVAVVAMRAGMSGISVPSRLYNILAAGRPVIAIADSDSEIAMVVREENIGWVVPPGDLAAFIAAIHDARSDAARLESMGRRARAAAERKYTRSARGRGVRRAASAGSSSRASSRGIRGAGGALIVPSTRPGPSTRRSG